MFRHPSHLACTAAARFSHGMQSGSRIVAHTVSGSRVVAHTVSGSPVIAHTVSGSRVVAQVLKLMEEAESQLVKGYNHKAVKALDDVLAKLRGMDVANSLFRAQVTACFTLWTLLAHCLLIACSPIESWIPPFDSIS